MKARLPLAKRYDRNCVLSATAGQIIAADALELRVEAIVIGSSIFDVGPVAHDIRLAKPKADLNTAIVAAAGTLAFGFAAGMTIDEIREGLEGEARRASLAAETMLMPWISDGRFVRLVRALDVLHFAGRREVAWSTASTS